MGQIGLGAMFMNGQVANVDSSFKSNKGSVNEASGRSFSKTLDKAKTSQSETTDKNNTPKVKDDKTNQVVQKPKDEVKKPTVDNKETAEVKSEDELEQTKEKNDVDDKILALLSGALNVTTEQLTELLNQMGYAPSDLLKQEVFGKFIGEVYNQIKGENLLLIDDGIKDVSKLFDQLQSMCNTIKIESNSLASSLEIDSNPNKEAVGQKMEQTVAPMQSSNNQIEETPTGSVEEIHTQNLTQTINVKDTTRGQLNEEKSQVVTQTVINENSKTDLGIVVPIQNFSTTVQSQLWQPEGVATTQVTQTPQLIESNIIEQIDFKTLGTTKEIHMQLSPKELGELSIKLVEENSSIVAHIKVDNEKAKTFLLNEMANLKSALEERGLTVVDVRVDIKKDEHQSQMEQQKQKSSKRIQEIIAKHMDEFEQIEEVVPETRSDSEVDYMV